MPYIYGELEGVFEVFGERSLSVRILWKWPDQ